MPQEPSVLYPESLGRSGKSLDFLMLVRQNAGCGRAIDYAAPGTEKIELPLDHDRLAPEHFRSYLGLIARTHLGHAAGAKLDASDIVQQTLLEAHRTIAGFRGQSEAEMASWLKRILATKVADAFRAWGRQKRDVSREQSLDANLEQTCSNLENRLAAVQSSPSARAVRNEQLVRLADALEQLPAAHREAIELYYLRGHSLADTAKQLERTLGAVTGLLRRGLQKLRVLLEEPDSRVSG